MSGLMGLDVKMALRALTRGRFVSGLAIAAIALGVAVTTAVFSIFNGVLLAPLPFPEADRVVAVYDTQPACKTCPASFPKYVDWRERNRVFSAIGGATEASFVLTGRGDPIRVSAAPATASFVEVFGVPPQIGRWFNDDEDRPAGPKVAVLTHAFWVRQFGADPGIVGQKLLLDGDPYVVLGVMPASFTYRRAEIFVALQRKLDPTTRGNHFLGTYARLKPGVTLAQAAGEMRALGRTLAKEFHTNHGVDVRSYKEAVVGGVRAPLTVLLGAVFLVLAIACANVANLLLASGLARRRELAIRAALGAARWDLARQMILESVLLAIAGGGIGILLAGWIERTFVALAAAQLPRAANVALDGRVLAFSAAVSLGVGVVCGIWPVLALGSRDLASAVREGDLRTGSGAGRRFGSGLVVGEIALAFALLVGAGLLVKNLTMLRNRDAGVRVDRIVAFDVATAGPRYAADERILAFYRELYERLRHVGGVESVGLTSHLPMYRFGWNGEFSIEGGTPWRPEDAPLVEYRWVFGDYFTTMGMRLVGGRVLDDTDRRGSKAVLINKAMAEKFWPGVDPIGKRFGQDGDRSAWYQVVGVVTDVRSFGLARSTPFEFYRTLEESVFDSMTVVMRSTSADPTVLVPTARQIVASIDPMLPVAHVQTMEQVVSESLGQPRLMSSLSALFGVLAGALAIVGVYGVTAYNVRRHRREFGIRLALGADAARVRALVVTRGLALAGAGVAIGGAASWMLSGVLSAMLNDVKPTDPVVFAATGATILAVAVAASYLPARSASRVDPAVVLRE